MSDSERFMTQAAAAKHFGVSRPLITRKKQQGKLVMKGALVDVLKSVGAFGGNGKPVSSGNGSVNTDEAEGETESYASAQARKEVALANLRELEHRQKLGELVDVADMERAWATAGQTMRDGLLSLPELIAPQVAAVTDPRQVRDILRAEIRKVIENIPEQIRDAGTDQQAA